MTKVMINPGICGFVTSVTAESEDQMEVKIQVKSGCKSVKQMFDDLGDTFDAYEVCLRKPGEGPSSNTRRSTSRYTYPALSFQASLNVWKSNATWL